MKIPVLTLALVASLALGMASQTAQDLKRERNEQNRAAKDALEGKPPPPLKVAAWLNTDGKALDWNALKGKVVVLDFWAYW